MTMNEPSGPAQQRTVRRRFYAAVAIAAAVAVALVAVLLVVLIGGDDDGSPPTGGTTTTPPSSPASASPSESPTASPTASPSASPSPTVRPFSYQPLWPFATLDDAAAWQRAYRTGGAQPWHLDAGRTALGFTTGFLGFTEVDEVVAQSIHGDDARIAVGYSTSSGRDVAAVLHLVRIGAGQDAPWEVVGTHDTDLTLTSPSYGAVVSSPFSVGGRITGVDENLRVQVRQPSSPKPIGETCCLPAGGERHPWTTRVSFRGATDPALTVVVSTGGHYQGVERFAVTAVRH